MAFCSTTNDPGAAVVVGLEEEECLRKATNELLRFFQLPLGGENCTIHTVVSDGSLNGQEQEEVSASVKQVQKEWKRPSTRLRKAPWENDYKQKQSSSDGYQIVSNGDPSPLSPPTPPYHLPPPPKSWPQRPLLVRATPGSSTQIVDVRHMHDTQLRGDQFWEQHSAAPINTGEEQPGEAVVVDFVSKHFVGSMLIRIKGVPSCIDKERQSTTNKSYFDGRERTFQGVVRGRFRHNLPMMDCVTGQVFRRPAGKLPAHWIINVFEAIIHRLAPHNEIHFEGPNPKSLSPLITTAQTIQVHPTKSTTTATYSNKEEQTLVIHDGQFFYDSIYDSHNECYASNSIREMEQEFAEPHATHHTSLVHQVHAHRHAAANAPCDLQDPVKNRKFRKHHFNQLLRKETAHTPHDNEDEDDHMFTTDKEYVFEFYQHLVVYDHPTEIALDLRVPLLHHIAIPPITNGQPIQMMSAVHVGESEDDLEYLWNFEVWHESLYPYAVRAATS